MIVSLTGPQWQAVAARIPEEWKTVMRGQRTQTYGRTHNYDLPAVCWRLLFDHLSGQAVGPLGGFTKGPDALYSAIGRIIRAVHTFEQHPALTPGLHVVGWLPDVIPCWQSPHLAVRQPYPPSPESASFFVLLVPRHVTEREWKLTTWVPVSATDKHLREAESLTYREDMQLVLSRQFGLAAGGELRRVPQNGLAEDA